MSSFVKLKFTKEIPERFRGEALSVCQIFFRPKWKKVVGLRGKFLSFRLNDCYRILRHPDDSAVVYHHKKYDRKIANLKRRGF